MQQIHICCRGTGESRSLVVRSRNRRIPGSKPDSTEDLPYMWDWCTLSLTSRVKSPPPGVEREFRDGVSDQASSSSSDQSS
ncbi:hypothetical protein AVEN_127962-1 [Araneus ventricosus]|uniref:Uncharacterized protein n=1 Tax=Araneus ventricosus TaxID=182803 RepID=A0A4Y2A037_ARAVE|nr:hypothetical protein AVEN_127962-1 [Araneus ventricosus]